MEHIGRDLWAKQRKVITESINFIVCQMIAVSSHTQFMRIILEIMGSINMYIIRVCVNWWVCSAFHSLFDWCSQRANMIFFRGWHHQFLADPQLLLFGQRLFLIFPSIRFVALILFLGLCFAFEIYSKLTRNSKYESEVNYRTSRRYITD